MKPATKRNNQEKPRASMDDRALNDRACIQSSQLASKIAIEPAAES
jgi:hypothetical protein